MRILRILILMAVWPTFVLAQSPDRAALEALYHTTGGPAWTESEGWLTEAPLGEWYGVTTYEGRVREIDLAGNGLVGQLPNEIAQLTRLDALDLRWNELSGPIPDVISNVGTLKRLYLGSNNFSGEIPDSLGYLPHLRELDLSYNDLSGSIPQELGHLSELVGVSLQHNGLSGPIPDSLGRVASLERVVVGQNDLSGDLPDSFNQLELLNLMGTSLQDTRGEFDLMPQPPSGLSGAHVLNEKISPMPEEGYLRDIIESTMAALHVTDGLLWIDPTTLPDGLPINQLESVAERINQQLIETGERIETIDDLNRMLEVYGSGSVELEEEPPESEPTAYGPRRAPNSPLGTPIGSPIASAVAPSHTNSYDLSSSPWTNSRSWTNSWWFIVFAYITCPDLKPHYAHTSTLGSGILRQRVAKGKSSGSCRYVYGPNQMIRYNLDTEMQRRQDIGIFWYFRTIAIRRSSKNYNSPTWTQSETMVEASCANNSGLRWWRTRISLIATGTKTKFYPRPRRRSSLPRYLEC